MSSRLGSESVTPPLDEAPAGTSLCNLSIISLMSESSAISPVESSLTPQLISKPTPPGDIAPPCSPYSTDVATTPPMGNPYPKCQSAIAHASPTMPGNSAVFTSCCGVLSSKLPCSIFGSATIIASANILPCFLILTLPGPATSVWSDQESPMDRHSTESSRNSRSGLVAEACFYTQAGNH